MLILDGQLRPAWDFLAEMMKYIPGDDVDPEMKGVRVFSNLLAVYVPTMLGEPVSGELPGREALDSVSEQHLGMRNTADVVYAMLLGWRGEFEPAAEILLNCARRDIRAHGTTAVPISISYLARLRLLQGKPRQAEALCREYLQYVNEQGQWKFYAAGDLDIILGEALLAQNRLEEAEGHIRDGLQTDEAWQIPTADALGLTNLARIRMAQGKLQEASEILQRLEGQIQGKFLLQDMEDAVRALKIRLQLNTGQVAEAVKWADAYQPALRLDFLHEAENLALARVKMAQGSYEQALTLLNQLSEAAEAGSRSGRLLEILLLKALSLAALDRLSPSYQALETCLELGEPEGILRDFLNEGEPLRKLLSTYLHSPQAAHRDYAKSLLAAGKPDHGAGGHLLPEGLIEPLTPRELEVLRLICAGDSNQAIAEKLFITVASVKKHTGNIYGKLGVTSRTQAIIQAQLLGLVP
jgi:LuxR family maltose regulon positive regulatory protein